MTPRLAQLVAEATRTGGVQARAAARLISLIENEPQRLPEVLAIPSQARPPRLILGVTGPPGAGKSTLIDALVTAFRTRRPQWRIGIIAVDPSSPITGGAVLGDRARMMRHSRDPSVFVRSLASRGRLGGLTAGVRGVVAVMSTLGFDLIVVETVGVGQNEVEVAKAADLTAIVLAPGMGDDLQLLKAGLLEVGNLFVVNKSDRPGADDLLRQVLSWRRMQRTGDREDAAPSAETDIFRTCATAGTGIDELVEALDRAIADGAERWPAERSRRVCEHVRELILDAGVKRLRGALESNGSADDVLAGRVSIEAAVDALLCRATTNST